MNEITIYMKSVPSMYRQSSVNLRFQLKLFFFERVLAIDQRILVSSQLSSQIV